jgi:hypothetical protein
MWVICREHDTSFATEVAKNHSGMAGKALNFERKARHGAAPPADIAGDIPTKLINARAIGAGSIVTGQLPDGCFQFLEVDRLG